MILLHMKSYLAECTQFPSFLLGGVYISKLKCAMDVVGTTKCRGKGCMVRAFSSSFLARAQSGDMI